VNDKAGKMLEVLMVMGKVLSHHVPTEKKKNTELSPRTAG
jgi:uncharacterized membrane protein